MARYRRLTWLKGAERTRKSSNNRVVISIHAFIDNTHDDTGASKTIIPGSIDAEDAAYFIDGDAVTKWAAIHMPGGSSRGSVPQQDQLRVGPDNHIRTRPQFSQTRVSDFGCDDDRGIGWSACARSCAERL